MRTLPSLLLVAALGLVPASPVARACTALVITDVQGNAYSGKTLEFATPLPFVMEYFPAATKVASVAPGGRPGRSFETKFPVLGVSVDAGMGTGIDMVVEGINDRGLSISTNQLNGSRSPVGPAVPDAKALAVTDLGLYLLGNFSSVAEVKAALEGGDVGVWLPSLAIMGNVEAPFHYVLFDRTGAGIVIEYLDGAQRIHDNPVGVATNAPEFPWHLKNLDNYAFLDNRDRNAGTFNKLRVTAPDSGNALAALPSTQISAGRFVKAAYYTQFVRKADSPERAVITLAHILNNFDRPYDLSVDAAGTGREGGSATASSSEVTQFTWMNDKVRNRYYLRTIDAMNFAMFEIERLSPIRKVVKIPLAKIADGDLDGTGLFLAAAASE